MVLVLWNRALVTFLDIFMLKHLVLIDPKCTLYKLRVMNFC